MDHHDHRVLGRKLELFHQQEEAPGAVFWHPRGALLYQLIEDYIRRQMREALFQEVRTPQLLARSLWEQSGHWEKFAANMFTFECAERSFALKPMSCPAHVQIFRDRIRSYRELPLRFCEFGACHRHEPSGALHGLLRGRAFTQDDAHIFCLPEQIEEEVLRFCLLLRGIYARFGFPEVEVRFATRPDVRAGSDEVWDYAEERLAAAARRAGLAFEEAPGEGAFYGPKLEFSLRDIEGRLWQCGTVQLDLVLPGRLGAEVINAEGKPVVPVMLHHAVLGSLERFIGILLEHTRGVLPAWLAPVQVVVAPIGADQEAYAVEVVETLQRAGLRAALDASNETLARRVLEAMELGVPLFAAVGGREAAARSVSLRDRVGSKLVKNLDDTVSWIQAHLLA